MARSRTNKYVKRQAKKFARKNKGFVIAFFLSLVIGVSIGVFSASALAKNDEFTLYSGGEKTATVNLSSGQTYDLQANENKTKVVVWGVDLSSYVTYTIKYINEEDGVVETVQNFTRDGTYCVIYQLDYTGDNFFVWLGVKKYEKVKLRMTIVIGGTNNG